MTEILFSEKHLAESVRHGCKHTQCGEKQYRFPSRTAENRSMLCRVVRVKNSERQSFKGLQAGWNRGQALTPEFTRGERFFVAVQQNVMCYI